MFGKEFMKFFVAAVAAGIFLGFVRKQFNLPI